MTQAKIEFSSSEELNDFIAHANPFVMEKTETTVFGLFTENQLELATKGFNATVNHCS